MIQELQDIFGSTLRVTHERISGNSLFMIANYLVRKESNLDYQVARESVYHLYQFLEQQTRGNTKLYFQLLENNLDVSLRYVDKIFVLSVLMIDSHQEIKPIGGLIIAHGYATASSIGNVANRLLDAPVFDAFDMPLDVKTKDLTEKIQQYVSYSHFQKGLVILVDMGSLYDIGKDIAGVTNSPIVLINNVSTEMALSCGELIKNEVEITTIGEKMRTIGQIKTRIIAPKVEHQHVLVISCSTGMGIATKLRDIFQKIFPSSDNLTFAACDFDRLEKHGLENELFNQNEVIGIIGTRRPTIEGIPFISIDELFSGEGGQMQILMTKYFNGKVATKINEDLIKNLSLERIVDQMTILDSRKILSQIESCLSKLETLWHHHLSNNQKLSLYVHISSMVERLIRNQGMRTIPEDEQFQNNQTQIVNMVRSALRSLETLYNIQISEEESYYIFDILRSEL
ncbi:PRD domain-containing protein [Lacticaseibacillus baoqingensis]|uniref:PRD domain-containing protein n=1 Tax=Lacticaseibacillus baoqingensis TaxID=2486013 RepID=A0ABW4EBD8_9LACO